MATEIHLFDGAYDLEIEQREPDGRLEVVSAFWLDPNHPAASLGGKECAAAISEVTVEKIAANEGVTIDALRTMIREAHPDKLCAEDERRTEERWGR